MEDWGSAEFPVSIMSLFQGDVTFWCSGHADQQEKNDKKTRILLFKEYLPLFSL